MFTSFAMASTIRHVKPLVPVPGDLECSHSVEPLPIKDIAGALGLKESEIEYYGDKKAKVCFLEQGIN